MKGIDTNVLVRYLVQDEPKQSKQATKFIDENCIVDGAIFINGIVLCELIWVLETCYSYLRKDIAEVIENILRTREFTIFQADVLWFALYDYRDKNIDFSDSYIGHLNAINKCEYTATFDKKATRLKHFRLLD